MTSQDHAVVETLLSGHSSSSEHGSIGFAGAYVVTTTAASGSLVRVLYDTGHAGRRRNLLTALQSRGWTPADIDIVVLSHLHWDHVQNVDLFGLARILLHHAERDRLMALPDGDPLTPSWTPSMFEPARLQSVHDGDEIAVGVRVLHLPGHSAGSIGLVVGTADGVSVLTGDAVSTAEALRLQTCALVEYDEVAARDSIDKVAALADVVYPGHDRPFRVVDRMPAGYLTPRRALLTPTDNGPQRRGFGSDNQSGIHPTVLEAITAANGGHEPSYGQDAYTARLQEVFAELFGDTAQAYPVFNGTGANVLALQSMLPRWGAVICARTAHINTDENAAPERVGGLKLLPVETLDGKLTPELIASQAWGWGDEHRAQPLAVSITESTELGTVYTPDEIRRIAAQAHASSMSLHMDGSRLANAAASLGVSLSALTRDVGVDVLSFGGTKNGLMLGECVVVLEPDAATGLSFLRKIDLQLASKMRFVSAQFLALLDAELWRDNAAHSNHMAKLLRSAIESAAAEGRIPPVRFTQPTQANAVFAIVEPEVTARLRESFDFETKDPATGEIRLMCSFDTTEQDIEALLRVWTSIGPRAGSGSGPRRGPAPG